MATEDDILSIDVEKIIAGKSKKLASRIPRFVLRYITKTIHQDDINKLLRDNHQYEGLEFNKHVLKDLNVGYVAHGAERLFKDGRYIFVSNHPLGGLDGMVLISMLGEMYDNVKFPVNDLLLNLKPFKPIFIPINKYGNMNHENAALMNETFSSEAQILYFPAGLCSRLIKGKIEDLEWKKTFLSKAKEYKRDVVPIFFEGRNSMFFYRLAKLRKFLRIKFNIETFYLPDELFKQKNSTFNVYIGEPISYQTFTNERSVRDWTKEVRTKSYELQLK